MVFAIKFGSPDEAAEEEYALRDGWGSEINTAVSGDTVYVEGGDLAKKVVKDWYPDSATELVDPPEDIAKMLHGSNEANAPKSYVLAHKGPNDTTYCKNKAGDWTTHIEDAWEGSGPDSFSAEMKRNFADAVHCAAEDLEVVPVEKFESKGADEKLSYEKGHKNSKGEDAPWVIRSHKDNSVLASFPTKKEAENHMRTMKRYSKTEGRFTEIKAAIKAAWSAAEAKWFRLDFQESTERLDVYPIASDNEGVGVNWGVLPERNTIVQYATDLRTGDTQVEREMPYKDLDELEKIFVDEFKSMDETLEVGADNGADIHPLTESRPAELNSKVPERVKKLILSPMFSKASMEDRVDFINKMYDDVEKAGIGDIQWSSEGSSDWQWAYVKPFKRRYYLITITPNGSFGTVTFNDPGKNRSVGETATRHADWGIEEFQKYLDERIPAIQAAYAKVKDYESKYYYYSFYSSKRNKNVKNKEEMLAVVEGTKGTGMTYYFRYGFAWKGAGRSKVPYEKFREYCNHAQVDIEVNYNTMEAEVNEFSENDMY